MCTGRLVYTGLALVPRVQGVCAVGGVPSGWVGPWKTLISDSPALPLKVQGYRKSLGTTGRAGVVTPSRRTRCLPIIRADKSETF